MKLEVATPFSNFMSYCISQFYICVMIIVYEYSFFLSVSLLFIALPPYSRVSSPPPLLFHHTSCRKSSNFNFTFEYLFISVSGSIHFLLTCLIPLYSHKYHRYIPFSLYQSSFFTSLSPFTLSFTA